MRPMRSTPPPDGLAGRVRQDVPLAPWTTLGVGGPARWFVEAQTPAEAAAACRWAVDLGCPHFVLGGGSNLLVADAGFPGVVVRLTDRTLRLARDGTVEAGAGLAFDALVDAAVEADLAGLECLTGIPGTVGAAPVQNIGAYGQEIADTLVSVTALDVATGELLLLDRAACGFGYRDSRFKRAPGGFVVLGVRLRLLPAGSPCLAYAEVRQRVEAFRAGPTTLAGVRDVVRGLRRGKAMLLDAEVLAGPDGRSAGSFFMNPLVSPALAAALPPDAPRHATADGRVKIPAAWLIERAGVTKGLRVGRAAVSTRHALALVNRDDASAAELVALAAWVRRAVHTAFGIRLEPEPVFLGFGRPTTDLLDDV